MSWNDADLQCVVERASSLADRLSGAFEPGDEPLDDERIDASLLRWRQSAANHDDATFHRRLAWDGLDEAGARRALATPRLAAGQPLPSWTTTLRQALEAAERAPILDSSGVRQPDRALDPGERLPFEELVLPFVVHARSFVPGDRAGARLTSAASAMLERALLRQLVRLFMGPLYFEFAAYRASRQSGLSRLLAAEGSDGVYRTFVARMHATGLAALLYELPVLARVAAQTTDRWIETTLEFLDRLTSDRTAIVKAFAGESDPGDVVAVVTDLSDAHHGGRTVVKVRFASGLQVVYKSRCVGIERAYFELLAWLNEEELPLTLRVLRILERPGYGWLEFVDHLPCSEDAEAERYFRRAGMLLCVVYVLGGDDCHGENIIASGEHPVLIDLETIMRPITPDVARPPSTADAQFLARLQCLNSVLGTGFLPHWQTNGENGSIDISGLGGEFEQTSLDRFPLWTQVNTDRMSLEYTVGSVSPSKNVVRLNGRPLSAASYADSLVEGFRSMYALILRRREAILVENGPLAAFARHPVRFLFRSTHLYVQALDAGLDRSVLHDGALRSVELEVLLSRTFFSDADPNAFSSLQRAEQAALEALDIPHFSAPADSLSLSIGGGQSLAGCFDEAPFSRSTARLRGLDCDDLEMQVELIRAALRTSEAVDAGDDGVNEVLDDDTPMTREELLSAARAIAEDLWTTAIRAPNGSASWIGLGYFPLAGRFQLQPIGCDLYGGITGVALFLAAFENITGERVGRLALSALMPLRRDIADQGDQLAHNVGIGGASGLGSVVYGLVHAAKLLNDDSLLEDASRAAALITPELIAGDEALDVISGTAGTLLGLLALYDVSRQPWVLERAVACGEHLVRNRVETTNGGGAWRTISGVAPLTGFSHGAAGISYALLRLYAQTSDPALRAAAIEGIAYEQSLFVPSAGNWPDVRDPADADGQAVFRTAWCHGAPGIALARLGGLAVFDTPGVRADVEVGLETIQRFGVGAQDHLCCGGMGRVEALMEGARRLRHPELFDAAHRQTGRIVRRALRLGGYQTQGGTGSVSPGFFHGIAGIGYALLRLAAPEELPSVLLWE